MIITKLHEIMNAGYPGLYLLQLPTGYGKSYSAEEAIIRYFDTVKDPQKAKRVVFVTTQKKNLPKKLKKKCEKLNFREGREIITLDSNDGMIKTIFMSDENLAEETKKIDFNIMDIDNVFKTKNFYELKKTVYELRQAEKNNLKSLIPDYVEKINSYMRSWFDEINLQMRMDGIKYEQRTNAVLTNPRYMWIADAFPFTMLHNAKIIMMSMDKLLLGRHTLVNKMTYLTNDLTDKNTILFIDEFDATKNDIRNKLIEHKTYITDYIGFFVQLRHAVDVKLTKNLRETALEASKEDERSHFRWDYIREETKRIEKIHDLNLTYRTDIESQGEDDSNILFRDDHFQTIGNSQFRCVIDEENNNVRITSFSDDTASDESRSLSHMMADIYGLIRLFANFMTEWSVKYKNYINAQKWQNLEEENSDESEMTEEEAISSILKGLHITIGTQLITDLCKQHFNAMKDKNPESAIQRYSYYTDGYAYYELLDANKHYENTAINMSAMLQTPESIILALSKRCTVIGMSATACAESVTGNYNLNFLRDSLGSKYHDIIAESPELKAEIRKNLDFKYEPYKDIKVQVKPLNNDNWREDIRDLFKGNPKLCETCESRMENSVGNNDYFANRYVGILKALMEFGEAKTVRSMLSLNMVLAKKDGDFQKDVLEDLVEYVNQYYRLDEKDAIHIEFLSSGNDFDSEKDRMLRRIENGEKLVIQSTYQTLGAGQNLQYKSTDENLVKLNQSEDDDRPYDEKDIDWIYLGDITNLSQKKTDEKILSVEHTIIMAEELCQNNEISKSRARDIIKAAFSRAQSLTSDLNNTISNTRSIKVERTILVLQAIGRIVRTNQKSKDIRIFIDQKVLSNLEKKTLCDNDLVTKEVEELVKVFLKQYEEKAINEEDKKIVYAAQNISSDFSSKMSSTFIREWGQWQPQWIEFWQELRKCVLMYPTASEEDAINHPIIKNFYIQGFDILDRYDYTYPEKDQKWFYNVKIKLPGGPRNYLDVKKDEKIQNHVVSEENARLQQILEYEGMREYFEKNNFATKWEPNQYILSPVLFNNFYKGALGEYAGKFIFENLTGYSLKEIEDQTKYEYFDYQVEKLDDVYVDFKHWCYMTCKPARAEKGRIREKIEKTSARHCFYIGLLHPEIDKEYKPQIDADGKITSIPYLINSEMKPDADAFKAIMEMINRLKTKE